MITDFLVDLNDVDDSDLLPAANYIARVIEAEVRETKAGTGLYIKTTFEIIAGDRKGARVFALYNIKNPNDQAVQIGMKDLKKMMKASGKTEFTLSNASDLCGLTCEIKVGIKSSDDYDDQNVIKKHIALPEGTPIGDSQQPTFDANEVPF